jgi:transposase
MVIIGVDAHKRTHTFVALDSTGCKCGEKTLEATPSGHAAALLWALSSFGTVRKWGVEDCRQVSRRLEQDLLTAGQQVVRVPTKLMARTRASARTRGKSDPIDAAEVARAALREPDLPVATHDSASRELRLLIERREVLLDQRTATINRLQWRIHELDPLRSAKLKPLIYAANREPIQAWLATEPGLVAELARDELTDIARLSESAKVLEKRIEQRVRAVGPKLLSLQGCGPLTAAKIMGEVANATRFKSEAAFARHIGVAPVPDWSGSTAGHTRMTRSGNRQLNAAVHRIALTQMRRGGVGRDYYQRRRDEGNTSRAAIRALKRRITRVVFSRLRADEADRRGKATADTTSHE